MSARIVSIFGPFKGTHWELDGSDFTIGRDASNCLSLDDRSLSRQHCVIRESKDSFTICDLNSHNGTFVNDTQIVEHPLKHGDYFKTGHSLFQFLGEASGETESLNRVEFEDADWSTLSISKFGSETLSSLARDFQVLMKVSTAINSLRALDDIYNELLRLILEAVPAERGAIVLAETSNGDFSSGFGLQRDGRQLETIRISRSVARRAFQERTGLVGNDVPGAADGGVSRQTLEQLQVRAFICVPLLIHQRALGVIYLDTTKEGSAFEPNHLSLLTAIAAIASVAINNIRQIAELVADNEELRNEIKLETNLIGTSRPMLEIARFITKVAPADSTVLIRGESGTGKELAARAIHLNSHRRSKPIVAINCATLSESLLESELFGHEKGAFTGATAQKKGKLEIAEGGTVFLDEVGELTPATQAKLLRVLQERTMERVGGVKLIEIDIRILAATNRNLEEAIEAGTFRRDLFYRLNVISCVMPSLRDRREDIPQLANSFAEKYGARCHRRIQGVSDEALKSLGNYDWPGNVRELENVIERAVVLGSTDFISTDDLPEIVLNSGTSENEAPALYQTLKEAKKRIIKDAIDRSKHDYVEAAHLLGIHPNNLHRLIRTMGLEVLAGKKRHP
jgi:Nif-specific regulatory protein